MVDYLKKITEKELWKDIDKKEEIHFRYLCGIDKISKIGSENILTLKKFELDGNPHSQKAIDYTRAYTKEKMNFDLIIKVYSSNYFFKNNFDRTSTILI